MRSSFYIVFGSQDSRVLRVAKLTNCLCGYAAYFARTVVEIGGAWSALQFNHVGNCLGRYRSVVRGGVSFDSMVGSEFSLSASRWVSLISHASVIDCSGISDYPYRMGYKPKRRMTARARDAYAARARSAR